MKYGMFPDITGQVFGKITVLEIVKHPNAKIRCECGAEKIVSKYDVFNGKVKSCGSKECVARTKDLVGQRFSLLLVLKKAEDPKDISGRCTQWECQCDCGNILIAPSNQLNSGRTKSCGCAKGLWISEKNSIPIKERVENEVFASYRENAKKRGYDFLLSKDEFISFLYNDCYYCGSPPNNYITKKKVMGTETHYFNGIDRINNELGYTIDNCTTCCKLCNRAKNDMTKEDFINLAKKIAERF